MKLGIGAMMPIRRSSIRLACVAVFVISGIMTHVNPSIGNLGVAARRESLATEGREFGQHHHHVENDQHQAHLSHANHDQKQRTLPRHPSAAKKKVMANSRTLDLHRRRRQHPHQKLDRHKKSCHQIHQGKSKNASFGILVCSNKTISAVFCPHGKLPHPHGRKTLVKRDLLSALNHGKCKQHRRPHNHRHHDNHQYYDQRKCKHSKGPKVAYLDIIPMHKPCPKSDQKDIDKASMKLTCPDLDKLSPLLKLGSYSAAAIDAVDRHNNDGGCDDDHHWHDKCTDVGIFCGIDLFGCNSIDDGLYRCSAIGDDPQLLKVCHIGACVSRRDRNGTAHCSDRDCLCTGSGYICGSSFPETCRLDENSLYYCKHAGSKPVWHEKCKEGKCPEGSSMCPKEPIDPDCLCQAAGTICGSLFPEKCNLDPEALYVCRNAGDVPKFLEEKSEGCNPRRDDCLCKEKGDLCGSTFPVKCELQEDVIYACAGKGDRPVFKESCPSGICPPNTGKCDPIIVPNCVCADVGDFCGSIFPVGCELEADVIYICAEKGGHPIFKNDCPSGVCISNTGECQPFTDCVCSEQGTICGSTFEDACAFISTALYNCPKIGEKPVLLEECVSKICDKGKNNCGVLDPCMCKTPGQICGSNFDGSCSLNPNSLYYCKDEGSVPTEIETCTSNSCPVNGNACDPDPCRCSSSGQICGSSFPEKCGYVATSLYFCKSEGSTPEFVQKCLTGICNPGDKNCGPSPLPENCRCKRGPEQICGSSFGQSCGLDPDTIYYCSKNGSTPVTIEKCISGTCKDGGHNCERPFTCRCKGMGTPCGSDFPSECNLDPDTKYQCGEIGDRPRPLVKYPPGECKPTVDPFVQDPCRCYGNGTVCGSLLQTEGCTQIAISNTSIYNCVDGQLPVEVGQCTDPQVCTQLSTGATCKDNPCTCDVEGATTCGGAVAASCGLDITSTYVCSGGSFIKNDTCANTCVVIQGKCLDKCSCPLSGLVCSSRFPGCGLNEQALYSCMKGNKPVLVRDCLPGQCLAGAVPSIPVLLPSTSGQYNDTCGPNPCYCDPGDQLVCDDKFPVGCKLQKSSVLSCPGNGGKPVAVESCDPLVCTNNGGGAHCEPNPCNCADVGSYCGSSFPEICHFPPNNVYSCEAAGATPVRASSCDPLECISNGKNAECSTDPCACTQANATVCASSFPITCRFKSTAVYSCAAIGDYPILVETCPTEKCIEVNGIGQCDLNPCLCSSAKDRLCASDFARECGYIATAIYTCPAELVQPVLVTECLPGLVCAYENGSPTCHNDLCHCHQGDIGTNICGNSLLDECEYDDNTIYTCFADGNEWEPVRSCSPGTCTLVNGAPKCTTDDCICKPEFDGEELCSANFPSICGLMDDTVYVCTTGQLPVIKEYCPPNKCVHNAVNGTAYCKDPFCICSEGVNTMCSADFPSNCGFDPYSVYSCKDPQSPIKIDDCAPDNCISSPPDAYCDENLCTCKAGDTTICGSSYPPSCLLKSDGMYQCEGNKYPVLTTDCTPNACYILNGTAFCERDDCVCKDGLMTACYSSFPATCGFSQDPKQILRCDTVGQKPVLDIQCVTECEVNVPDVSARCKPDPCNCADFMVNNTLCASQFDSVCGYSNTKLYYCPAVGVKPTEVQDCSPPSICAVDLQKGECIPFIRNLCLCEAGVETACGMSFDETCGLIAEAIYDCRGREGLAPILITDCNPQTCLPDVTTATCSVDPCLCSDVNTVYCGSTLPAECGFDPDALYACTAKDTLPIEIAKCEAGSCDPTTSACKIYPCACQSNQQTCGSDFDAACGLDANSLYDCAYEGADPVLNKVCTTGCVMGSGQCTPDPCKCTTAELKCGSAFDPSCGLHPDTLYECKRAGDDPLVKEKCITGGCVAGTTACQRDPCKCGTAAKTCGKDYLVRCGFNRDQIYTCSGQGATPQPGPICGSGLCESIKGGAVCRPDCTCKTNLPTCGVDFPPACRMNADTLYGCASVGAIPVPLEVCKPGACRSGTHQCFIDPCACKFVGQLCGSDICTVLMPDTIYVCDAEGATPTPNRICPAGTCKGGKCAPPDECLCTQNGPFCGGELPCPGLNPDLYYSCSIGKKPFPFNYCKDGKPTNGDCLCNDGNGMCSTYFPFECGYDQNQVMACPGGRNTKPVTRQQCGVGRCLPTIKCDTSCYCTSTSDMCGKQFDPSCNYKPGTIYKCSGAGAIPQPSQDCGPADLCFSAGPVRCLGECQCKSYEPACGAAFPASCNLKSSFLYRCDYAGAAPVSPQACPYPCNPQNGPDRCGMTVFSGR